ncbi:MAG: Gx transporter family protein [Treponema sp.]|nr:Gx transporter family protein [Treponema sp.]
MNKSVDLKKLSFFAALCFFLSVVETAIPKPVPFFRLGLANLPVMLSFAYMSRKESSLLILLKVLLQAIVSGTLFSYIFLFSLAGSLASGFGMMAIYSIFAISLQRGRKHISWIGISMCGGLLNNAAQLFCAYFVMFGDSVRYIAPLLLTISFVTSLLLGAVANIFAEQSEWLKTLKKGGAQDYDARKTAGSNSPENAPRGEGPAVSSSEATGTVAEGMSVSEGRNTGKAPILFLIIALCGIVAVSFSKKLFVVYGLLIIFVGIVFVKKKRVRILPSIIIILSVTVLSLLTPYGKILFAFGKWNITWGALESGLLRSGKLCAMVFMSQSAVDKNMKLPGRFGAFMERVFGTVSQLTEEKIVFDKGKKLKSIVPALDKKLMEVWTK